MSESSPHPVRHSFIELDARERARALFDPGTARELLGPFDRIESPWLAMQNVTPQADDGCVVMTGRIDGVRAVVIAIEGAFQGGSIGEVSGAKISAALDLAHRDNERGLETRAVLLLETGGVRLQEANLGLAAVAEVMASILALRQRVPVVCVTAGTVGCFGGMTLAAGLCSYVVMTREARLGMNGPEVIEQEAGADEFDAKDRGLIWATHGGEQRYRTGLIDALVQDDATQIARTVRDFLQKGVPAEHRSAQIDRFRTRIATLDPSRQWMPQDIREIWTRDASASASASPAPTSTATIAAENEAASAGARGPTFAAAQPAESTEVARSPAGGIGIGRSRGRVWFEALTGATGLTPGDPRSVLTADADLGGERARFLCVVPDPGGRFPRARQGEVGLEEAWTLAARVREAIDADAAVPGAGVGAGAGPNASLARGAKRPIIAIVDVKSQAYGRREEIAAIYLAAAAAADAYASARMTGHPVITLIVGSALSGAFLAHGYQANRILAFDDVGVMVHAMHKEAAARVTRRSVAALEALGARIAPLSYDIHDYAKLGLLHKLLHVDAPHAPAPSDVARVREELIAAVADARQSPRDLRHRLDSPGAREMRRVSREVRRRLEEQWEER